MNTYKFKTTVDDQKGVEAVRKVLEADQKIQYWYLDLLNSNHYLTVTGENLDKEEVQNKVNGLGFETEEVLD